MTFAAPAMAGIGMASSLAGGIFGAEGAEEQGAATQAMYNYQSGVATMNAQIAQNDANYATAAGINQGQQTGIQLGQQVGQTKAAFGAGNITGGSQTNVVKGETEYGQQQEANVAANAAKQTYGYKVAAAGQTAQAGADIVAGQNAMAAAQIGATSSILGSIGSVSSKWAQSYQSGIFSG